ncbi:MAG: hypothetical protein A3J54_01450 [Candidatus Ryanbacteria bacterium RIFCSPHIGHO2_02_FULL_45_13b]|uniref:Uncharacterized protein n=1 Tax=Candidatus Ryanbacteria bacterium RIFCSPHIGHO2_02_FULL_45_13b TaxID=1802117 RepID=A0A1G2GBJ0_9BACT|nr:MAG: hypothetical protein A3J54_01450 [Candidatus Ryanbacteria bacterium RIFCSPHIGHO2_02_FULL_45_13b]
MRKALFIVCMMLIAPILANAQTFILQIGPLTSGFFISQSYCEVLDPCGSVGVYIENLSTMAVSDGEPDNGSSSFLELYVDDSQCGGDNVVLRFAPLSQKLKQGYKALPFAQGARAVFKNLTTKHLPTGMTHRLGLLDVSWGNDVPELNMFLDAGSPAEQCNTYVVDTPPAWLLLKLDGTVLADDMPCDVSLRLDASCVLFSPK